MLVNFLYLIPSLENSGGMERVLTDKVNYLSKNKNYNVKIITTDMAEDVHTFYTLSPSVEVIRLNIHFNKIFKLPLLKRVVKNNQLLKLYKTQLENFLVNEKIDICISMGAKELEFFSKLESPCIKIFEAHFNPKVRSSFLKGSKGSSLLWQLIGRFRDWQYLVQTKDLDKVVVLTKSAKAEWNKTHRNVELINNPSPFLTVDNHEKYEMKRVITVGRLEDQKGYDLLIQSWVSVHQKYPDWILDIYGDGSQKTMLQSMISQYRLDDVVSLKGVTRDVRTELLQSDFYVMSSRYEGLPMVLLESLSCCLPIVSFDCPTGPAEIIENNDCGVLAMAGDTRDLSCKIVNMIENKSMRLKMSKNAGVKSKNYSIDKVMQKWDVLFREFTD